MSTNIPIHAGFAEGFNKATYDDTMQEFFDYMCENYYRCMLQSGTGFLTV